MFARDGSLDLEVSLVTPVPTREDVRVLRVEVYVKLGKLRWGVRS